MVDTSAKEFGNLLGKQSKRITEIEDQGFGTEAAGATLFLPRDTLKVRNNLLLVTTQLIGSAFILGHPVNGQLGTSPFTLGSGGLGSSSEIWVSHSNNTYIENFGSEIMTSTDVTTATVNTSDFKLDFGNSSQTWYSNRIFYDSTGSQTYNSIVVTALGSSINNLTFSTSLGGTSWDEVELGKTYKWETPGSDIRIKVENDNGTYVWPTPFGTWGGIDYAQAYLTEVKVIYGNNFGTNVFAATEESGPFNGHATLTNDVLVYWKFDDDYVDATESGYDGTGTGTTFSSGKVNNAADFGDYRDGKYIQVGGSLSSTSQTYTINYWAYNTNPLNKGQVGHLDFQSGRFIIYENLNHNLQFNDGSTKTSTVSLSSYLNTWVMITWTFNSSTNVAKLFINGSDSGYSVAYTPKNLGGNIRIGDFYTGGASFAGRFDEIGIWERVLTEQEISDLYNGGSGLSY